MGLLAKPLGWLLTQLYSVVGNYGITLVIVTIIVKVLLYPLYKKQILSTSGMGELQPKMQALQKKYSKPEQKAILNEKISELYKEEGVNPMAGCLPMIVQMVIIMGLFALLRSPMAYLDTDSTQMYFAIHESFLWIKDLSQPDLWILPILAGIATYISFTMNQRNGANPSGGANMNGMMSAMKYFFPIMIVWMARSYPSGLAIYWFISQFIQIFFNIRFAQLRKAMREKNSKTKKKKK